MSPHQLRYVFCHLISYVCTREVMTTGAHACSVRSMRPLLASLSLCMRALLRHACSVRAHDDASGRACATCLGPLLRTGMCYVSRPSCLCYVCGSSWADEHVQRGSIATRLLRSLLTVTAQEPSITRLEQGVCARRLY